MILQEVMIFLTSNHDFGDVGFLNALSSFRSFQTNELDINTLELILPPG